MGRRYSRGLQLSSHMRKTFDPRGKGGNIVREIADMLAKNGHRGIHVEWTPPRKQARHDAYRLWQGRSGVWRLTLNISGEPRIIARLGELTSHIEVEVRRKLDELFGTGIEKEDVVMSQQEDPSGPAGEVAMPELPVDERPPDQKSVSTPASHPTGDRFNREWLVMILESLLEGKEEVKILQLYRVIMEKAEALGLGGSCDRSKIHRALVALQKKDATIEVNRQGVSSTWTIRRKTSESVQAADPPAVGVPSMTEEGVLVAIIKMADGVPPSVDGWIDIPHIKGRIVRELYGGRHAGYGKLAGILDALQRTGRLDVRQDGNHPDVWCVRFPEAVKESVSVVPAPALEAPTVPAPAFAAQDPLSMVLARQMSPEEFCNALRDFPMVKAVEIITRLVNMQAQIRRLLTTIANDEVFAMMHTLVTRISAEREE